MRVFSMPKSAFYLLTSMTMLFMVSCNKKYKEPVDVGFRMDVHKTDVLGGSLQISDGFIALDEFEFEGDREKGDDVYFTKEFETPVEVVFNEFNEVQELDFVIPQGVYKRLDIRFKMDGSENHALVLNGLYSYQSGGSVPFRLELDDADSFEARAEDSDDESIILDADIYSPAKILLDPVYWFSPVPVSYFEDADLVDVDGTTTLLVNKDTNQAIYDLIVDRVNESVEVKFNY